MFILNDTILNTHHMNTSQNQLHRHLMNNTKEEKKHKNKTTKKLLSDNFNV